MLTHPLRFEPRACARVWGGHRLALRFGRALPEGPVGESWEIWGELPVASGPYRGTTLEELARRHGESLLGRNCAGAAGFPLLVKWLDCQDWLSVQVHPDDAVARRLTGDPGARGKTECWIIAEAEEGAEVIHGLAEGSDPEDLARPGAALLPHLRRLRPRPGQVLFTPAGMVHALGPGLLLLEIQQSCDLTYRLYDWDRPGLDGRPRDLHPEQAAVSVRDSRPPDFQVGPRGASCPMFSVELLDRPASWSPAGGSFDIVALLEGAGRLEADGAAEEMRPGDVLLVPAAARSVGLDLREGSRAVRARVPEPGQDSPGPGQTTSG